MVKTRDRYNVLVGERKALQNIRHALLKQRDGFAETEERLAEAMSILETMSDSFRDEIVTQVSALLTSAMEDIFGPGCGCRLYYRELPSGLYKPEFEAWDEQGITGNPMDVFGGSAVEIIAISLRIFFIVRSGQPKFLAIDEPLRGIDEHNVVEVGQWLRTIAEQLEIQLVMVSHIGQEVFEDTAHRIFVVRKNGGTSTVRLWEKEELHDST